MTDPLTTTATTAPTTTASMTTAPITTAPITTAPITTASGQTRGLRVVRVYHGGRDATHRERDRALVRAGIELTLIVPDHWPGADDPSGAEPFEVVEVPVRRSGDVNRHSFLAPALIAEVVEARGADVVDVHEEPFSVAMHQLLGVLAPDRTVVGYTAQNLDKRFPPPFARRERHALGRLDGLYPCSSQAASVVVGKGFRGVVSVLPLAPPAAFAAGQQCLPGRPVRILLAGRLPAEKGILDAVRVAAGLDLGPGSVRLDLAGDGPEAGPARELAARLGVELHLHGHLGQDQLARLYAQAHVVLVPSRTSTTWAEQFGRTVVEAQASGAVVAGYASGALAEVVGPAGVLVAEGDLAALTAAVADLLARPDRWQELRVAGLAAAPTWDAVAYAQLALYRAALRSRARTRLVIASRPGAVALFGPPAPARPAPPAPSGGTPTPHSPPTPPGPPIPLSPATRPRASRPFALPVLRDRPGLGVPIAAVIDATTRHHRRTHRPLHVVYLDHVARLSGGEIALVRLIEALGPAVRSRAILGETGPLAQRLRSAGAEVEVLALPATTRERSRHDLRSPVAALAVGAYVARLAARLRALDPDLVHANSLKSGYYGTLAARLAGVPIVWHLRDRLAQDYLPGPVAAATRRLLAHGPQAVLANSQTTLRTAGPHVTGVVVADPYVATAGMRPRPHDGVVLAIVGRLDAWKGHDVVLRAFAQAFPARADVHLRVVGGELFGPAAGIEATLRARAVELGIGDAVTFTGFVDDVEAELAGVDVLVHASTLAEPFGQVVVEGLAAGVAVIAAAAGGPAEILTDDIDGLLVPPGEVDALAAAMARLADDPSLRARLGAAGRTRSAAYAAPVIAEEILQLYAAVLGQPR